MGRSTVEIDSDIHRHLRSYCDDNHIVQKGAVSEAVTEWLEERGVEVEDSE